jgi:Protein of unknown function (DUF3558)
MSRTRPGTTVDCVDRRLRLAGFAVLGLMVTACASPTEGAPVPAAGFATTPPPPPKKLAGLDLCGLLKAEDLAALGGLAGQPAARPEALPQSCGFPLNAGSDDFALVGPFKAYDEVRAQQSDGHAETASGYRTWVKCAASDTYETCTAAVAVRDDSTFVVGLTRRGASERQVVSELQKLTETVLTRLPPG